jgi:hypothetical protein
MIKGCVILSVAKELAQRNAQFDLRGMQMFRYAQHDTSHKK